MGIPSINGWQVGVPPFMETIISPWRSMFRLDFRWFKCGCQRYLTNMLTICDHNWSWTNMLLLLLYLLGVAINWTHKRTRLHKTNTCTNYFGWWCFCLITYPIILNHDKQDSDIQRRVRTALFLPNICWNWSHFAESTRATSKQVLGLLFSTWAGPPPKKRKKQVPNVGKNTAFLVPCFLCDPTEMEICQLGQRGKLSGFKCHFWTPSKTRECCWTL